MHWTTHGENVDFCFSTVKGINESQATDSDVEEVSNPFIFFQVAEFQLWLFHATVLRAPPSLPKQVFS